ncbi:MAG TPA: flagellar hook-length control protein FliK [Clostridiales bacterium]|nr:flagellar hook-length control protein FliK [Clostridiales bacterium]
MEQIQCNGTTQTTAISPAVLGEAGEKSDLFPKMLKEQSLSAVSPGIHGKKDGLQGENGNTGAEANGVQTALETGTANQQHLAINDWFIPTVQGKSMGPPVTVLSPLQVAGNPEGMSQNPAGPMVNPKAVSVINGKERSFPVAGNYFSGVNTTEGQGSQAVASYAQSPLPTGQSSFSLTGSAFMPQTAGMLQGNGFTQNPLFGTEQGQHAAAVLSPAAGEPPALAGLNPGRQGMSVFGETKHSFPPLSQTAAPVVSAPGQVRINQISTPVMSAAAAMEATPLPEQGKNPSQASQNEALQPVKMGFPAEMAAQNRGVGYASSQTAADRGVFAQPQTVADSTVLTQPQTTVDSVVLSQSQNGESAEIGEQKQSADYAVLQNTARVETLNQSQVKTTDQTQNAVRSQLTYQINAHFDKGRKAFEMQLYPKDLGKVNVKMTMENSTLIVEISAASAKTQSIILANADDIRALLQSHMHQEVQLSLPQEQKSAQQQLSKDEQGGQHNPYSAEDQQAEENEEQQELDTEHFLKTLNMLSEKYFRERNQEYAD